MMGAYTGHGRCHGSHPWLGAGMPTWWNSFFFVMRYDAPAHWHLTLPISVFIITLGRSFELPRLPVVLFSEQFSFLIHVSRAAPNNCFISSARFRSSCCFHPTSMYSFYISLSFRGRDWILQCLDVCMSPLLLILCMTHNCWLPSLCVCIMVTAWLGVDTAEFGLVKRNRDNWHPFRLWWTWWYGSI